MDHRTANTTAGHVGAQVNARDVHGGVHFHAPTGREWPARVGPVRVGVVPRRAGFFQPRAVLAELVAAVSGGEAAVLTGEARVLSGLGGVGKTQLAADYAERAWRAGELDLLVWVAAGSASAIVAAYATAADRLGWYSGDQPELGARRFLERLAELDRRWLVVLDDLRGPEEVRDLWPPLTGTGRVVATTRRRDAALTGDRRRLVEVGVFSPAESLAYLRARLGDVPERDAAGLADDLGHLPLALSQATAYLLDEGLDVAAYRARFAERRRTLDELLPEPDALPDDHRTTVSATWSLSIELAERARPRGLAPRVLDLASVLDPHGVPEEVFTAQPVLDALEVEADQVRSALRCLHRLGLATHDTTDPHRSVRVHALVQRATRDELGDGALGAVARTAADALLDVWPPHAHDLPLAQALYDDVEALERCAGAHLWTPRAHPVLADAGTGLGEHGLVDRAREHFERLVARSAAMLGADHHDHLLARGNLARWRGESGDVAGAVAEYEALWADGVRVLGADHPDVLRTRNNLVRWRGQSGDVAGALAESEALSIDVVRVLGAEDLGALVVRDNVATWRGESGDVAGALAEYEAVLADAVRVLGADDPTVLRTRGNLARWRGQSGDVAGALAEYQELLADAVRVLGADHPDVLTIRGLLADLRGWSENAAVAAAELAELLADGVRVLGAEHPDVLAMRGNLAQWRGRSGDAAGAVAECEALLADEIRVLGADHPSVLMTRGNLTQWHGMRGEVTAAIDALEALLPDVVRVFGPDHPHTATTRDNLDFWREKRS
ncbi:FxSxx-COOH system tetratricopeptide repeat protein [Saccharopolyspora sp. CA-218241]|uniref:FxSxx-COOH system tetratricopeptide repeat protein n=1 Tax=Saccharopolyspora sp. CA-218241 TaxID=3240027 RepID=UPI003D965258